MMKMKRKLAAIIAVLVMVFSNVGSLAADVFAAGTIAAIETVSGTVRAGEGDASIILQSNEGQPLIGKTFHIYQLFHAVSAADGSSVNYTFCEDSKIALQQVVGEKLGKAGSEVTEYEVIDYIQSIQTGELEGNDSEFRHFVELVRDEFVNLNIPADYEMNVSNMKSDGTVLIEGLPYGYYIVDEVTESENTYSASSLCMVTTVSPQTTIKIKSDYPWMKKQIQEDDQKEVIGNDGWTTVADYEIGQTIPYKITSNVPNMNGYSSYYYAWHDVMDDAILFDPNSVKVVLSDGTKEYTLLTAEYSLKQNTGEDTFVVEIPDLKAIVDAQFAQVDELGHQTYGQQITLTYQGTLTDSAREDIGVRGFENKARLEFSNNPDSDGTGQKGHTPWDSVVCFTYQLNGLKKNNLDEVLANAKFSIYRDEACTDKYTDMEYVSDENGLFVISGLDSGIYYLKETEAPDGYRVLLNPIKIEIESVLDAEKKELSELYMTANMISFYDGVEEESVTELEIDKENLMGNLTVTNRKGTALPVTGSAMTILLMGAGTASVFVSEYLKKNKKQATM